MPIIWSPTSLSAYMSRLRRILLDTPKNRLMILLNPEGFMPSASEVEPRTPANKSVRYISVPPMNLLLST